MKMPKKEAEMKIIRVLDSNRSFCSSEINNIMEEIEEKIKQSLKTNNEKRFIIEIFDLETIEKLNPAPKRISKRRDKQFRVN